MFNKRIEPRKLRRRTVYRKQTETMPGFSGKSGVEIGQHFLVEIDKCLVLQLLPGFAESALGDQANRRFRTEQGFEKMVKFVLDGAFNEVDEIAEENVEGEAAFSGEVLVGYFVLVYEIIRSDDLCEMFDKVGA